MYRYTNYQYELYHFGVKGMKWGVRRYQNEDGSYTNAGKSHYGVGNSNGSVTVYDTYEPSNSNTMSKREYKKQLKFETKAQRKIDSKLDKKEAKKASKKANKNVKTLKKYNNNLASDKQITKAYKKTLKKLNKMTPDELTNTINKLAVESKLTSAYIASATTAETKSVLAKNVMATNNILQSLGSVVLVG